MKEIFSGVLALLLLLTGLDLIHRNLCSDLRRTESFCKRWHVWFRGCAVRSKSTFNKKIYLYARTHVLMF